MSPKTETKPLAQNALANVVRKRTSAEKHEAEAARLRREAIELEARWLASKRQAS